MPGLQDAIKRGRRYEKQAALMRSKRRRRFRSGDSKTGGTKAPVFTLPVGRGRK